MTEPLWVLASVLAFAFGLLLLELTLYGCVLVAVAIFGEWEWFKSRKLKDAKP